jgi:hypothetical protein
MQSITIVPIPTPSFVPIVGISPRSPMSFYSATLSVRRTSLINHQYMVVFEQTPRTDKAAHVPGPVIDHFLDFLG